MTELAGIVINRENLTPLEVRQAYEAMGVEYLCTPHRRSAVDQLEDALRAQRRRTDDRHDQLRRTDMPRTAGAQRCQGRARPLKPDLDDNDYSRSTARSRHAGRTSARRSQHDSNYRTCRGLRATVNGGAALLPNRRREVLSHTPTGAEDRLGLGWRLGDEPNHDRAKNGRAAVVADARAGPPRQRLQRPTASPRW